MGEAYMEFGLFGIVFFIVTAFIMGRWWLKAHSGDTRAILLYAAGLAPAVIMPTAYASYFFNIMLLYGGVLVLCFWVFSKGQRVLAVSHNAGQFVSSPQARPANWNMSLR